MPITDPTDLSGLHVWFDATQEVYDHNDPVGTFTDQSGNGRDATQATAANKPTFKLAVLPGRPGLDFDGGDWLTTASWTSIAQPNTVFVVGAARSNSSSFVDGIIASARHLIFRNGSAQWAYYAGTTRAAGSADASAHVFCGEFNGASSSLRVDGTAVTTANPGSHGLTGLTVGSNYVNTSRLDGIVCEVVVYDRALTSTERGDVETYLTDKWLAATGPDNDSDYADAVLSDSPLLYLKMDEADPLTAWDSSGNDHHGTYQDTDMVGAESGPCQIGFVSPTWGTSGRYVIVPAHTDFGFTNQFTVECLMSPESGDTVERFWWDHYGGGADGVNRAKQAGVDSDQFIKFQSNNVTPQISIPADCDLFEKWVHVAITYDNTRASPHARVFFAGVESGGGDVPFFDSLPDRDMLIGRRAYTTDPAPYVGRLAHFAVYTSVLSDARIAAHANASGCGDPCATGGIFVDTITVGSTGIGVG